jgi:Zn-dependent peptidase ImmA (M78 family)
MEVALKTFYGRGIGVVRRSNKVPCDGCVVLGTRPRVQISRVLARYLVRIVKHSELLLGRRRDCGGRERPRRSFSRYSRGGFPVASGILLESKGVRVFSLAIDAKEVDAFSMWYGGKPFVFLNTFKSAEHCRFDAAHELGHLVLHRHGQCQGSELEREANAFASAFLMPRKSVLSNGPRQATLPGLVQHKKYWTVSVAALNYRLHALGMTTDWTYRTLCIQLAEAGYRIREPEGATHEKSTILEMVFSALRDEGISKAKVAGDLLIPIEEIDALTFGLMLNVLVGGGNSSSSKIAKPKTQIKLVR